MTTEIRPWMQHVRRVVEARSYSKPREISIEADEPEAYVEWGGPSQFDHENQQRMKRPRPPGRERYTYTEEARYFGISALYQRAATQAEPNFGMGSDLAIDGMEDVITVMEGAAQNIPDTLETLGTIAAVWRSFSLSGPNGEQHRFYQAVRLNGPLVHQGYSPIIEPTFLAPSWQNPYDFIGADDA